MLYPRDDNRHELTISKNWLELINNQITRQKTMKNPGENLICNGLKMPIVD